MKNIKLRIVYLILCSALLLFADVYKRQAVGHVKGFAALHTAHVQRALAALGVERAIHAGDVYKRQVETRVTDETLRRIRKKLLQAGSTVSVSTIWGFGYKLKGAGSV